MSDEAARRELAVQVGQCITQARRVACVSQRRLAQLLGTQQSLTSRWETGQTLPPLDVLLAISEALSVPLAALIPEGKGYAGNSWHAGWRACEKAMRAALLGAFDTLSREEL